MKRSDINRFIDEAITFFDKHNLKLPPWASWTEAQWKNVGSEAHEIHEHGLGWNITDFGSNKFHEIGLLLFIMRNGFLKNNQPQTSKTYAEKAMMVRSGQVTPWHFHWMKTEDLINRGGGRLEVEVGWASEDEKNIANKEVLLQCDGITKRLPPEGKLILEPGQSVTFPPLLCHQFKGCPGDENVCVGEVSSLNDDSTDNCFIYGIKPRIIEEDVQTKYLLCSEYSQNKTICC
jgi:hypothetical protein